VCSSDLFFGGIAVLMGQLARMYDLERSLARTDPLTGLANRRAFVDALDLALRAGRQPITVVYLDVDDFKRINDRFGHPAGDQVLMDVADLMRAECRAADLPARLGGDEFALLLVGVPDGQVLAIVDRVLQAARRNPVTTTLSAGAFSVEDLDRSAEAVLASADRLMYQVKRTGKGRVVMRAA
jgi:diguanylate cyclase (GGDEF)-like protein